ncbi:hypothetical protein ACGH7X_39020 [Streptomyces sp. BBFR51]|uniref:hypothetical protein n=1 Tax=Streptomyces sp. BBFR51 TaxID=3372856 RepID=UPI0037DC2351
MPGWADTSRVDFSAWPARGERADDDELVARAVAAWARPARSSSSVTTAAAITVSAGGGSARYLLAPWISEAASRDLLRPDDAAHRIDVSAHGVTGPVPTARTGSSCERWPVLQLRSSPLIVEDHSFLLADLGGLSPVHLTYTPAAGGRRSPATPAEGGYRQRGPDDLPALPVDTADSTAP